MNSTATIFARLAGLASSLATYNGAPAIFSERAPDDFLDTPPTKPFLIIAVPTRDEPMETFTETGRLILQDVRGYQRDTGSGADLDTLMRAVRDLFHNRPSELTVTGGRCDVCRVNGPMQSPTTDPSLIGRRVSIRLDLVNT
ncbi:hypothetical protein HNP32_001738 [Brevundimonas bullata]|uniref:Uncharacterized protein n=1 Tax=Brevundimonas bullata TaxID=13160 RepID=A0A7W7IPA1_9CAUL|nr:hypothetical protein [Brevundimonas bullata]MBB4798014.1 hypothetical protein [Brevundimonas bullata]MBB6382973.1 hypothetical protein [Brevundimonas bullata]